ncbi:efflux RND transporter permease subunit [Erwinia sp. AnSW2-5]|uniref:efflux RND transporter permease subunit n=1 Tax=Erwinia sp. AnSW2-5 TaxID=3367692 RepID=UPI00385BB671
MKGFNLSELAVRERSITVFFLIITCLAGIYSFINLGRAEDPVFTIKSMTITAAWPGATAKEMQQLVAEPLEKRLQELTWYDRTETFSRPGLTFITLTLKDETPPAEVAGEFYQSRKKIMDEQVKLPSGVQFPQMDDEYGDVIFTIYALKAKDESMRNLVRTAEDLKQQILTVPGVKKVNLIGEQAERIFVDFNYHKITTLGLSLDKIRAALAGQNRVAPAGAISTSSTDVFIRTDSALSSLERIENTPIVENGRTIRLKDIATVKYGYEDPPAFKIRNQGTPVLLIGVVMYQGWNGLKLGDSLREKQKQISSDLPLGMSLVEITNQADNIKLAINEFMLKFFIALTVIMLVSLFSLGWRVGLIISAAVPLTLSIVFIIMLATHRDFDRVTLGALILSLGLLVDDAIIAIESMIVRMQAGFGRIEASSYAWSHTAAPMLAGTLVTAIGLMPVGFARSSAGEYAGNIFWIVAFSLIVSWLVAVTFVPYLGVKLLPEATKSHRSLYDIYNTSFYNRMRKMLSLIIRFKWMVSFSVFLVLGLCAAGMGLVEKQFFPISDRPEVMVEINLPSGTSIEQTSLAAAKVEAWLQQQSETLIMTSYIGQGAPRFYLSISPELPNPAFAKIIVLTKDQHARDVLQTKLRNAVVDGLSSEARVRVSQIVFGPYVPYPIAFRVTGPDSDRVKSIATEVQKVMLETLHVEHVNKDWGDLNPTLHFIIDQSRLNAFGLTAYDVASQLRLYINGVSVSQVRDGTRTAELVLRSSGEARLDPSRLNSFTFTGSQGQHIPLSQVGQLQVMAEEPLIKQRNRLPTITVQADAGEGYQPPDLSVNIMERLAPLEKTLGVGYRIEMAGSIEESIKANDALEKIFPIMLILMLSVIIFQVRSIKAMFMVILTAPLGLIGVVPVLILFNQPFGFNAILGLIGLAGILMRNTLILIGQIQDNVKAGLSNNAAIMEATVQRFRPVFLTALAAILAFIPLTQSVFWGSLAYTLIGGTIGGTIVTLLFLPSLYAIFFKVKALPDPHADQISHAR